MQKRITLLLSLALCLAIGNVYGQAKKAAPGKINGKVIDASNGQAVEYATVALLKPTDSSLVNGTITGTNGNFAIDNIPLGKYLLRISFMGYETYYHPQTIQFTQNKPTINVGKIKIKTNATTLKEATIVAERSMVEYKLDKRVVNVDKNIVTGGGTATDVLENVPSVTVDNDGNVSLRGSSNVKVLIDGKPYELMGSDLSSLLEQIPATTIENVEVITNPSAKYDPEGMSGIINIKLKERSSAALGLNGVVNLNAGTPFAFLGSSYPRDILPSIIPTTMGSVNLNYSTEKYNIFFSADAGMRSRGNMGHSEVERLRNGHPISYDSIDNYNVNRNYMGSMKIGMEYYINKQNSILFSYQIRGGKRTRMSNIISNDILDDNMLMDYTQTDTNNNSNINNSFSINYTKKFDEKDRLLTLDATFSTRQRKGDGLQEQLYPDPMASLENYYLREAITLNQHQALNIKLNYVHPFEFGWLLETGYEGRMDWPDQNAEYFRTEYDSTGSLHRFRDDISSTHFNYAQHIHAAYATMGGTVFEGFTIQGGLRLEYTDMNGKDINHPQTAEIVKQYWELYPTLHLSYDINKDQSVQLSYSRRVRRPHFWDLNPYLDVREGQQLSFGNPNLDPEFTNAIELSYNLGIKNVNIFSSAYFRQTNNMMTRYGFVWDAASAEHYSPWMPYNPEYDGYWASTWQNLSTGLNYGLEFIVDYQITKWWKVNASINLYNSKIEGTELLNNESYEDFLWSGKLSSYMTLPKNWTVQLSGQYRAPWLDLQTRMYASYWVDLAMKKDVLNKRGTISIRVSDVLCTGGWGHETYTEQMNRISSSKRLSPYVTVGFSYKINNGLKMNKRQQENMEMEADESMVY